MSEHDEQVALFEWAQMMAGEYPELNLLHAIPNGAKLPWTKSRDGKRYSPEAIRLKREGLKPGVPDMCLPVARGGYHGLYIELKFGNNKLSPDQTWWLKVLTWEGYKAIEARGWEAAAKAILEYLQMEAKVT